MKDLRCVLMNSVLLCVDIKLLKFIYYMVDYGICIFVYFFFVLCLWYDVLKICVKFVIFFNIFVVSYRVVIYCFEIILF